MRARRMALIFLAFYLVFIGGSAYYTLIFPVRFFHHGLLTVLIALWFWGRWRLQRGLPKTPLNLPIYAAVVVGITSAIFSIDARMAFENLWFAFIHLVFFFVLVDLFQRGRHRLVMETQFILAALVVFITALEVMSWYLGLGFVPGTDVGWIDVLGPGAWLPLELPRVSLAMNISTLLAGYVAPLVMLTLGWALTARRRDYRRVLWLLAGALLIVVILTGSRGGLMSLGAALTIFLGLRLRSSTWAATIPRMRAGLLIGVIVAVIGGTAGFLVITLSGALSSGDEVRLDLYDSALEMAGHSPVLGVGPGLYGRALRDYRAPEFARDRLASAHNVYLNTIAETGLLGAGVAVWLMWSFGQATFRTWRQTPVPAQRARIEAAVAALIGLGVHSLVDVFTTTPLVLVILLLAAFSITGTRSVLDAPPKGALWPCAVGLLIACGYGVWFVQLDRAHLTYQFSLVNATSADSLELAKTAAEIDPYLNLYDLHIAYLMGKAAQDDFESLGEDAITAYERAIILEPTWDVGWMNLATLEAQRGNMEIALDYVARAYAINPLLQAGWNWPRLLDLSETGEPDDIAKLYAANLPNIVSVRQYLPVSDVWFETEARQRGLEAYIETLPVDLQYRFLSQLDPDRAAVLVTQEPESAAAWWVLGEYTLSVMNDAATAEIYFTEALSLSSGNGDYYGSRARARARADDNQAGVMRDLDMAYLLGTRYEQPSALRAQFETDSDVARRLLAVSLPSRPRPQEFAAVLYGGRAAVFDLFPAMRFPGPGRRTMQPWYTVAENYIEAGDLAAAREVYEAIIDYAPDEDEAKHLLAELP